MDMFLLRALANRGAGFPECCADVDIDASLPVPLGAVLGRFIELIDFELHRMFQVAIAVGPPDLEVAVEHAGAPVPAEHEFEMRPHVLDVRRRFGGTLLLTGPVIVRIVWLIVVHRRGHDAPPHRRLTIWHTLRNADGRWPCIAEGVISPTSEPCPLSFPAGSRVPPVSETVHPDPR